MRSFKRSYSELSRLANFEERYDYLQLNGSVGLETFGGERYLNQRFYTSTEWRQLRYEVIARDRGCDLGLDGYEIHDNIIIHHMNPMSIDDIESHNQDILNPEYLISVTLATHNAIHYGTDTFLAKPIIERSPGDTQLW